MKLPALGAMVAAALGFAAVPAQADGYHQHYHYQMASVQHVITVSCYRGPWDDVIWDRPEPIFIDSLVQAGYSFGDAHGIAERVCRDPSAVGSPGTLRAVMSNILATNPPRR